MKIEGYHVRDFHLSIFLQSKKMIKIHTYTPIFLYHIAVAQTFFPKKKLAHSMGMYGCGKLRKKRKKKQKLRNELFKGLRLSYVLLRPYHNCFQTFLRLFIGLSVNLPVCRFFCLFQCLPVRVFACLSV